VSLYSGGKYDTASLHICLNDVEESIQEFQYCCCIPDDFPVGNGTEDYVARFPSASSGPWFQTAYKMYYNKLRRI